MSSEKEFTRSEFNEELDEFAKLNKEGRYPIKVCYETWRRMIKLSNVHMRKKNNGRICIKGGLSDRPYYIELNEVDNSLGSFFFDKYFSAEKEEKTVKEDGVKINNAIFHDVETNTPIMKLDSGTIRLNGVSDSTSYVGSTSSTPNLNGTWTHTYKVADTYYNCSSNTSIDNKKENDTMDTKKILNVEFGPCSDSVHMSAYGPAIKNQGGEWVSYDAESGEIINVEILNFAEGGKFFYKMPVPISQIDTGDILIHNRQPVFVSGFAEDTLNPIVINIYDGTRVEILPTRSCFGFAYCTKIVSLLEGFGGKMTADADHPFGNLLPLMLLSGNGKMEDMLLPMMMMQGGQMDMSNPLMLYMLMGKDGKMNDMLPLMLMMNQQSKKK